MQEAASEIWQAMHYTLKENGFMTDREIISPHKILFRIPEYILLRYNNLSIPFLFPLIIIRSSALSASGGKDPSFCSWIR
jgi:hypothetical protein